MFNNILIYNEKWRRAIIIGAINLLIFISLGMMYDDAIFNLSLHDHFTLFLKGVRFVGGMASLVLIGNGLISSLEEHESRAFSRFPM